MFKNSDYMKKLYSALFLLMTLATINAQPPKGMGQSDPDAKPQHHRRGRLQPHSQPRDDQACDDRRDRGCGDQGE